jgi:glycosyltransferase involved in cell wall biosynthesis
VDGLAYGAMPATLIAGIVQPIVALVHHPLCLESGLTPGRADELKALETAALAFAHRIVVTSPLTSRTLAADFGVPADRITIAQPGTAPAARAVGSGGTRAALLSVGSVVPRKGYDVLVDALARVAHLDWSLTIAGALDRSPPTLAGLRRRIADLGLAQRITLAGPLPTAALDRHYEMCDVFVLASYYEGYGMVLAEAMAHGLAIVTTTGGAAAETVPDDAALKVPAGDADALAAAIGQVIRQPLLRRSLADAAWAAGQKLPRWTDTAGRIARVLREVAA